MVLVAGQDRFESGQYTILAREVNTGGANPPFESIPAITALTAEDGLAPGGKPLGPFVAFASLTNVVGLLAPSVPGSDFLDGDPDDIDLALAVFDERTFTDQDELDELFALA